MLCVWPIFFNQTKGGRPTKPKLGGKRSATVSEAVCDADRSTVFEHDISTDSTLAMQGPSTSTPKRFCAHTSFYFTTNTNITNKTAEHYLWPKHTSSHQNIFGQCDFSIWKIFPSFSQQCDFASDKRRGGLIYHTHLTRLKMRQSGDKLTLTCKARGQPLIFKKVVKPRKTSTAVSVRKRRAALLGKIRMDVSGGVNRRWN